MQILIEPLCVFSDATLLRVALLFEMDLLRCTVILFMLMLECLRRIRVVQIR